MLAADSPNEGFEGGLSLADNTARLSSPGLTESTQAQALFRGEGTTIPNNFPQANVTSEFIDFTPDTTVSNPISGTELNRSGVNPIGDAISSLVKTIMEMPGPMGLISQLFQFFSALFEAAVQSVEQLFDPTLLAQQAQSAIDFKKLMQLQ